MSDPIPKPTEVFIPPVEDGYSFVNQEFSCLHEPINIPPWPPILTAQQFPQTEIDKWAPYIMSEPAQEAPKTQP